MTGFTLIFEPWNKFHAHKKPIRSWLQQIADASEAAFKGGMGSYPPASSPGAWPNNRTGILRMSIRTEVLETEMTIGSNRSRDGVPVSKYLQEGTSIMKRRKMSDDALREGMQKARLGRWVQWVHGAPP